MTRTMYDSVNLGAIPATAEMVAHYVDGLYRTTTLGVQLLFPYAVLVPIAVFASTNDGLVLDVETGDATPAQAVDWVLMRRAAGVDPSVYCNASTWGAVDSAFQARGVAYPHYWIAKYDGVAALFSGSVAKQYNDPPASGGDYDISIVADYWPGIDGSNPMTDSINVQQADWRTEGLFAMADVTSGNAPVHPETNQLAAFLKAFQADMDARLTALEAQVAALKPTLSGNISGTITGTIS